MSLFALSLAEAAADIREGRTTSTELVDACLGRIDEVDNDVRAWAFLDRDHALAQAAALDEHRRHGRALGPLHGVPVGIKDIFDTSDYPTELGSPLWAGRTPRQDAAAVGAVLRAAPRRRSRRAWSPGRLAARPTDRPFGLLPIAAW
jgi:Asp-tRNA(Asn)/Glu-tRNA(Gln) amidotransferase A subunit family amidase